MTTLNRVELVEIGTLISLGSGGGSGSTHDPVTVSDTASVDLVLAGQVLSATVIPNGHGHDERYAALTHGHEIIDVTGLQAELDTKIDAADLPATHEHMVAGQENSIAVGDGATVGETGINKSATGANSQATGDHATAYGQSARALGDDSLAAGWNALVPATSPRSAAIGANAAVPENTPDTMVLATNALLLTRSDGLGRTVVGVQSPDGTIHWLGVTSEGQLLLDEQTVGTEGPAGAGVPPGGAIGQVLAKISEADLDTGWVAPPEGTGGGGATHDPVTITDTASIDLSLTGQTIKADVKADGHTQAIATVTGLQTALDAAYKPGGADVALADGGTGASNAETARTNLGAAASTDLQSHSGAAAAHGVTGAVVGTTNVQTLTNKTLTAPVVTSPTGIVKADVGLSAVPNLDARPRSTHSGTQLATTISDFTATAAAAAPVQSVAARTGAVVLAKADIGLANVENTSDAAKPVSTATQTILDAKGGKVTASVASLAGALPTPESGGLSDTEGIYLNSLNFTVQKDTTLKRVWYTPVFGMLAGRFAEGNHLHDDRYYTEAEVNALLAAMRPLTASAVRSVDSGLTGTTSYAPLGDPALSIPVSTAYAHRVTVHGHLRCDLTTSTTSRSFYGRILVNGVIGTASQSSGATTSSHGPQVIEALPLVWTGDVAAGVSSIGVGIEFRASSSGAYLTIESGTSLIADVTPLV